MRKATSRFLILIVATSLVMTATAVFGQLNKCVDGTGKVSYQERPCPGVTAAPIATRRSSAPPLARGPELTSAEQEQSDCAETWNISGTTRYARHAYLKDLRDRGKGQSAAADADEKLRDDAEGTRFLARCGKFGFIWPQDEAGETKNSRLVDRIRAKIEAQRQARRDASAKQEMDRQAQRRAQELAAEANRRAKEPQRSNEENCKSEYAALAKIRAEIANRSPTERQTVELEIEPIVRNLRARCGG